MQNLNPSQGESLNSEFSGIINASLSSGYNSDDQNFVNEITGLKAVYDSRQNSQEFFAAMENFLISFRARKQQCFDEVKKIVNESPELAPSEKERRLYETIGPLRGAQRFCHNVLAKIVNLVPQTELEYFANLAQSSSDYVIEYLDILAKSDVAPISVGKQLIIEITKNERPSKEYLEKAFEVLVRYPESVFQNLSTIIEIICERPANTQIFKNGKKLLEQCTQISPENRGEICKGIAAYEQQKSTELIVLKLELAKALNLEVLTKTEVDQLFNLGKKLIDISLIKYLTANQDLARELIPRLTFMAEDFSCSYIREIYKLLGKVGRGNEQVLNQIDKLYAEVMEDLQFATTNHDYEILNQSFDLPRGVRELKHSIDEVQLECLIIAFGLMADSNPEVLLRYIKLIKHADPRIEWFVLKNLYLADLENPRNVFQFINTLLLQISADSYFIIDREISGLNQGHFDYFVIQAQEYYAQLLNIYNDDPLMSNKIFNAINFIKKLQEN